MTPNGATVKTLTASDDWSVFDWDLRAGPAARSSRTATTPGRTAGPSRGATIPAPFTRSRRVRPRRDRPEDDRRGQRHARSERLVRHRGDRSGSAHSDALSGVRATYYSLDGGAKTRYAAPVAIAKSGVHELDYWSVDKAGNVERTSTVEVRVDVTAPTTKVALSGPVGEAGFYRDDVTVALDASDAQSGVAGSEIAVDGAPLATYDGPIVVSAAGTHVVSFRSTDVTGRRREDEDGHVHDRPHRPDDRGRRRRRPVGRPVLARTATAWRTRSTSATRCPSAARSSWS